MSRGKKRRETRSGRKRSDSTGWASLYQDLGPEIRSWFVDKVASAQDVDDLVEEVLAKLARTNRPDDLQAYIATAAANALSDYQRRRARERDFLRRLLEHVARNGQICRSDAQDVSEQEESHRNHPTVEEMLRTLPPEKAQLLRLRFMDGLRMAEVARRVGCSRDAAYKRVRRIIQRLRERYGIEPPKPATEKDTKNPWLA